jgi:hypothetical protein
MHWVVVFWHDEPVRAARLMRIINDISLLHNEYTTDGGVYVEGVCQYSYMSIDATLSIAALYARAFGEVWPALDAVKLQAMGMWQMDAHGTDGYAVEFGDSCGARFRQDISARGCHWFPRMIQIQHACHKLHSSRVFTHLTDWHRTFRPNTEGTNAKAPKYRRCGQ